MMEPDVLQSREGLQLSFVPPHRLTDACIYPRKATNGSHIIIYGHDDGLRVLWYAGRRPKKSEPPAVNGNSIDLTEDDADATPEYEQEEDEIDPSHPFRNIIAHADVTLGTSVTCIAVPPLSAERNDELHHLFNTHVVILVACADLSLRLVTLSLEPPTEESNVTQQLVISGSNSHQDLVSAVAITIAPASAEVDETRPTRTRSRSRGRDGNDIKQAVDIVKDWSVLLASTSTSGTGLLLIHQIPLNDEGRLSNSVEDLIPIQRRFLRYPLAKCTLAFNPSLYPSSRYSNLLVASSDSAVTKIYQAIPQSTPAKKRRGSATTIDSTTSSSQATRRSYHDKVLMDLFAPFPQTGEQELTTLRKRVLDAKWILHGRAVIVLLDDGEWGIWDLEAAGPTVSTSSSNLVKGQSNISGVQGGSLAKFAMKGHAVTGTATKKSTSSGNVKASESSLAPMTPHTRKARSQGLFKGQTQSTMVESNPTSRTTLGCISVLVQSGSNAGVKTQDESIIFSYGPNNIFIPSIRSYWRAESGTRGPFDGSANAKPLTLPPIQTAGEEKGRICLMPRSANHNDNDALVTSKAIPDFLVATSSRLILFVSPLIEPPAQSQNLSLPMRFQIDSSSRQDQLLLNSGELDVDGMDRILDNMAKSNTITALNPAVPFNGVARKSVGFQLDNDDDGGDVDMDTPTTSKGTRNQLLINRVSDGDGRRRLFS